MESKKSLVKELILRLGLILITIPISFFLITFPIDIKANFSVYSRRNEYKIGEMIVTRIGSDSYGSPHLFADGYVNNIKTGLYLGLERDVRIQKSYTILYRQDGKSSFLITKDFKFNPIRILWYGILELISIPFLLLIIFKIYKYFKNDNIQI
ncbi:hypothetical protein NTJ28_002021 [Flavobacterium psychrophilum]|nr:hypothetical protein [Flavobacterium psychrophilum]EKT4510249.1 hypothetical protein [Flavobacterium psychrophilum]